MTRRLVLSLALLFTVAACGGGDDGYADAASVAKAAGFTSCTPDTNVISTDAVDCDEGRVNWFKSGDAQDSWDQVADAVGDLGGPVLTGSGWAIECASMDTCRAAKAELGGKIG